MIVVSGVIFELRFVIAPLPVNVKTPLTDTLPSTIRFLVTPTPPLKTTLPTVELEAAVILAKTV